MSGEQLRLDRRRKLPPEDAADFPSWGIDFLEGDGRCGPWALLALLVGLALAASRRPDSEGAIVPHDASTATRYSLLVSYLPLNQGHQKRV